MAVQGPSQALAQGLLPGCPMGRGICAETSPGLGGGRSQHIPSAAPRYPDADALTAPRAGPSQLHQHIAAATTSRKQHLGLRSSSTESQLRGRDVHPCTHTRAGGPTALWLRRGEDTARAVRQPVKARPVVAGSLQNVEPD